MADSGPQLSEETCKSCGKPQSQLPVPLKKCAKCHSSAYCSRECQKADWKEHKKVCKTTSGGGSDFHTQIPGPGGRPIDINAFTVGAGGSHNAGPFQALTDGTYLHNIPEKDAYRNLIDSYRLRVTDEYTFSNTRKEYGRYSANHQPLLGFRTFLDRVESKAGLMPPWWTGEKRQSCETMADNQRQ